MQWNKFYDKIIQDLNTKSFKKDLEIFLDYCRESKVRTILDLGSGNGQLSVLLLNSGFKVIAVDINRKACSRLLKRIPSKLEKNIQVICTSFNELPIQNNSIDAILAVRSLSHGNSIEARSNFQSFIKALKPGGLLFLYMTAEGDFRSKISKKIDSITWAPLLGPEKDIPHIFPSKEILKNYLEEFLWINHRIDSFSVPKPTPYFNAHPSGVLEEMKNNNYSSKHHCLIAKKLHYNS